MTNHHPGCAFWTGSGCTHQCAARPENAVPDSQLNHHPGCGEFTGGTCTHDCRRTYPQPRPFLGVSVETRQTIAEVMEAALSGAARIGTITVPEGGRERALDRVLAYHENAFARLTMDQAQLLLDDNPDRPAMDALNRQMGRHASILAELRR